MTRAVLVCCLGVFLLAGFCAAAGEHEAEAHGDHTLLWKWVNFILLGGALGYLISKKAGAFFSGRTQEIQKGIREATRLREEAEARAAEIDRRLSNISAEIEELRRGAREEMAAEAERLRAQSEALLRKIAEQAEQEILWATKAARQELKVYSAELALGMAERRIRAVLDPQVENELVRAFVAGLERRPPPHRVRETG